MQFEFSRKRKRLTKNKRRCDGFLPCSNCDFSGKQCTYSDNNGHSIPPPNSRSEKEYQSHLRLLSEYNLFNSQHGESSRAALNDPILKKELVLCESLYIYLCLIEINDDKVFLDHMYPFNLIFHKPSLLYALERDKLSPLLLNSIFALSSRLSPHPKFQHIEAFKTGQDFATIARKILLDPDDFGSCAIDKPRLEVVQSAIFLSAYEFGFGNFNRAYIYLGIALSQMKILGLNHDDFTTVSDDNIKNRDDWINKEERRRTAWVVIMLENTASAINGRAKPFEEHELKIFLPIDDVAFELAVGNVSNRDYIKNFNSSSTTEFGYLIRIVNIFSNVMAFIYFNEKEKQNNHNVQFNSSPYNSLSLKQALSQWSNSLPQHLELNAINLNLAMMSMQSGANSSGWCYAFMHAFAECSVFYLHSTIESNASEDVMRSSAERQNQSVGNMRAIIDALGTSGRKSPLIIYFLYVVSKWQLHVQGGLDASIADIWDDEISDLWNLNKTILNGGNEPPIIDNEVDENESENENENDSIIINDQPKELDAIVNLFNDQINHNPNNIPNPLDLNLLQSNDNFIIPSNINNNSSNGNNENNNKINNMENQLTCQSPSKFV